MPVLQSNERSTTALIRTVSNPSSFVAPVRRSIQGLERTMPVADIQTLDGYFQTSAFPFRAFGMVLTAGGLLALLLATIGIYGTVSHSVAQRRKEVGIRMALGAERSDILKVVVGQGMAVVAWGLGLGVLLGVLLTGAIIVPVRGVTALRSPGAGCGVAGCCDATAWFCRARGVLCAGAARGACGSGERFGIVDEFEKRKAQSIETMHALRFALATQNTARSAGPMPPSVLAMARKSIVMPTAQWRKIPGTSSAP